MIGARAVHVLEQSSLANAIFDVSLSDILGHVGGNIAKAPIVIVRSRPEPSRRIVDLPPTRNRVEHAVFVVISIHDKAQDQLFLITQASSPCRLELGFGKSWQKHASQDGDNGNDHQ